jgi:hypothetical protein
MVGGLVHKRLSVSRAPASIKTYQSGWNSYLRLCDQFNMIAVPVTEAKLVAYSVLAHEQWGLLAQTVRNYIQAISFYHRVQGLDDPRGANNLLDLVLDGCRRTDVEKGYTKRVRKAITSDKLRRLLASLNWSDFRHARFGAYVCCSYFAGFRVNELVRTASQRDCLWSYFDMTKRGDDPQYFLLTQHTSKPMQFGPTIAIPLPITNDITCPYRAIHIYRSFFDENKVKGHMPAFMSLHGDPYTYDQALVDVRYFFNCIGEDGDLFGTHSFRIGLVTEAGRLNVPEWMIQLLGRWKSMAFKVYMQTDPGLIAKYAFQLRGA